MESQAAPGTAQKWEDAEVAASAARAPHRALRRPRERARGCGQVAWSRREHGFWVGCPRHPSDSSPHAMEGQGGPQPCPWPGPRSRLVAGQGREPSSAPELVTSTGISPSRLPPISVRGMNLLPAPGCLLLGPPTSTPRAPFSVSHPSYDLPDRKHGPGSRHSGFASSVPCVRHALPVPVHEERPTDSSLKPNVLCKAVPDSFPATQSKVALLSLRAISPRQPHCNGGLMNLNPAVYPQNPAQGLEHSVLHQRFLQES